MNPLYQQQQQAQQGMNPLAPGYNNNPRISMDQMLSIAKFGNQQQVKTQLDQMVKSGQVTQQQVNDAYSQAEQMCKGLGLIR